MPHKLFEDLQGYPRIEEVGRKGMAQTVRGIMPRHASGREIVIHEAVDVGAKEVGAMPFRTRKEIGPRGVMGAPDLEGLLHIRRHIHDTIHLPFTPVDPDGTCTAINRVPCERTDLGDA
jgi:hypothetical protein